MAGQRSRKPRSKYETDLEKFITAYIQATGDHAWTTLKIANWLIKTGQWEDQKINAAPLSLSPSYRGPRDRRPSPTMKATRSGSITPTGSAPSNPCSGRRSITSSANQMHESKTMRRNTLAGGAIQLFRDLEYYNKNHNPGEPLGFDPDFTNDIEERGQPGDYDDTPPSDADNLN